MLDILLVEDNPVDTELITEAFEEACESCRIRTTSDGEEALELLKYLDPKPDIVLMDLNLPKKNGIEVLKELRSSKDSNLNIIPVIILTNSRTPQDIVKAYKSRCNAFMRKPVGYQNLVNLAGRVCKFWHQCAILPNQKNPPPS